MPQIVRCSSCSTKRGARVFCMILHSFCRIFARQSRHELYRFRAAATRDTVILTRSRPGTLELGVRAKSC